MNAPSPYHVERAMSAAMQLQASLVGAAEHFGADDQLILSMLEGETDIFEILDRLIETSIADAVLAELAAARAKRLKARTKRLRETALNMILALEITKPFERAAYTASISRSSKVMVTDADLLPRELMRSAPDIDAIMAALKAGPVNGAMMSNPMPHLTVRTR